MAVIITDHAYHRANTRFGWDRKQCEEFASLAYQFGLTKSMLGKREKKKVSTPKGGQIRRYQGVTYVFKGNKLITIINQ